MTTIAEIITDLEVSAMDTDMEPGQGAYLALTALKLRRAVALMNPPKSNEPLSVLSSRSSARRALEVMVQVAESWAQTAHENDVAMDRHDVKPVEEQPFFLADIIRMVNDSAQEFGLKDPIREN
jgi:hypothetical protein